jgi:hypothetical protein
MDKENSEQDDSLVRTINFKNMSIITFFRNYNVLLQEILIYKFDPTSWINKLK